jgi:5-formyltetrahydrofolate cyclo-ligase
MSSDKKLLRQKYKSTRLSVDLGSVDEKSLEICRQAFWAVDWDQIKQLCSYRPMRRLKEVDTSPLHDTVKYKFPAVKIKLLKPDKNQALLKTKFDVIIVPCLAFDIDNYRLGWGGGFYDQFLATQAQALKIGLAYQDSFVSGGLPREPHDIPLDIIITEKKVALRSGQLPAASKAVR